MPNLVVTRPLNGPGLVRITCNTHTWMRGFIVVTDEMAAVTGADGGSSSPAFRPAPTSSGCGTRCSRRAPIKVTVTAGGTADVKLALAR